MGFRERPEYQEWRDAVFRLFGRKCIRCGYAGNIHAHHVKPVTEYPELAFEPTNGVPLCGNCHTEIKGDELAHVDNLQRLQRAAVGGEAACATSDEALCGAQTLMEEAWDICPCGLVGEPLFDAKERAQESLYAAALRYAKRAIALASTDKERIRALLVAAEVCVATVDPFVETESYADARNYLEQALQIDESNVYVLFNLAGCYGGEGNSQEAVRLVKKCLTLDPNHPACQFYLTGSGYEALAADRKLGYWCWLPTKRELEEQAAAQRQRQHQEELERHREAQRQREEREREALRQREERKREAQRQREEQQREAGQRREEQMRVVPSAIESGLRWWMAITDMLLRPLAGEDNETLLNLRIALAAVLLAVLGLLGWGAYSVLHRL